MDVWHVLFPRNVQCVHAFVARSAQLFVLAISATTRTQPALSRTETHLLGVEATTRSNGRGSHERSERFTRASRTFVGYFRPMQRAPFSTM